MRLIAAAAAVLLGAAPAAAEPSEGRTLDELKTEIQARADRNAYPLIGLKPEEVREALSHINSLERDAWAMAWSAIGDRYMAQARAAGAPADADKAYLAAWHYYSFARWPVPNSPGKQQAYLQALEAWRAHARLMDPAPETVRVPFEGKEVVGYVQMPKGAAKPVPFVIAISGLDSRKEEMIERFRPLLAHGVGTLALDSPGTGEAPVKVAPGAERTLVAAIDAVLQRPDIDKSRVALFGGSYGAFWASLLAVTQRTRLRAVVAQSPPVHTSFARDRTMKLADNREYLFDYVPAQLFTYQGTTTLAQLADARERQSLKALGVLDQPTAPMLVIAGVRDTQVEMSDIDLLLHSGPTPKEAWIHPAGGHMGRDAKDWPDPVIFRKITMPWLLRALEVKVE
jgi:pimeloyl-ACP methyl ester carboxylesterase